MRRGVGERGEASARPIERCTPRGGFRLVALRFGQPQSLGEQEGGEGALRVRGDGGHVVVDLLLVREGFHGRIELRAGLATGRARHEFRFDFGRRVDALDGLYEPVVCCCGRMRVLRRGGGARGRGNVVQGAAYDRGAAGCALRGSLVLRDGGDERRHRLHAAAAQSVQAVPGSLHVPLLRLQVGYDEPAERGDKAHEDDGNEGEVHPGGPFTRVIRPL